MKINFNTIAFVGAAVCVAALTQPVNAAAKVAVAKTPVTANSKPLQAAPAKQSNQFSTATNMVIQQANKYPNTLTKAAAEYQILQAMSATQARANYVQSQTYATPSITAANKFLAPVQPKTLR